jgi:hypothetical protein
VVVLSETDGDLWPVRTVVSVVPIFDEICWFGFKVGTCPIHEQHVKSDIMVLFEDSHDI